MSALPPFTEMTAEDFQRHLDERSVNTHDGAAVASWFSEDGVQRLMATGEVRTGREAVAEGMNTLFGAFPDVRIEVTDLFSAGDRTAVQCVMRGTNEGELLPGLPPTGRTIEVPLCLVFRWSAEGLADEENIYSDNAAMFQQLGLA